jgi:GT2 family glycosyltransferase
VTPEPVPITLAICSNRPPLLANAIQMTHRLIQPGDHVLVVVDGHPAPAQATCSSSFMTVLVNNTNRGLACSRNRVLKECETRYVIFLDDDVIATREAVEGARTALSAGADVIGARITADYQGRPEPWYLTAGQLHYLGAHSPAVPASIWGGFLGVDIERTRLLGVDFDERLGRTAKTLGSAEDTTFVRKIAARGGRREILPGVEVRHLIPASRLTLPYLVRRAFWQGRSEYRRRDAWPGLRKEWSRNWQADCSASRRTGLTALFGTSVAIGVAFEAVIEGCRRHRIRQLLNQDI